MFIKQNRFIIAFFAVLLLAASFVSGYYFATAIDGELSLPVADGARKFDTLPKTDIFWDVWGIINQKFVTDKMPSDADKMYGAIGGVVRSLDDPYSVFFPPQEAKEFESEVQGSFSGVGMEVGIKDDVLTVIAPLKGTPAEKAGIRAGDKIIAIDGESTFDMTIQEAVRRIRGEKGSTVVLTIVREGEEDMLEIPIVRDEIEVPVIDYKLRDDGVYVISLYSFTATSPKLFAEALEDFMRSGSTRLIIDLRGNPGGYLESAVNIASMFLPAGEVVAREYYGTGKPEDIFRSKGFHTFADNELDLVILLDGGSASASEILAGALREHGIATLIGTQSFGKGSVQELIDLKDGSSLKLTVAKWLTPNGVSISEKGLTPDIEVAITKDDIKMGKDPQMEMAVRYLLAKDKDALLDKNKQEE